MRAAIAILIVLLLAPVGEPRSCPRPCKKVLAAQLRSCKKLCPRGKAGRTCRRACTRTRRADVRTCRSATKATPPLCGRTPLVTPTSTTTTNPPAVSTTTTPVPVPTTTTTAAPCIPTTCAQAGAECGSIDDGCGGTVACGACPSAAPVCVANACRDSCGEAPDFTPCDTDANLCTLEECMGGSCQPIDPPAVNCGTALCWAASTCNPATGLCELSGYAGDGAVCGSGDTHGVCAGGICQIGHDCAIDGTTYAAGDRAPPGSCRACQPEISRTVAIPIADGPACAGGFCTQGTCSADVCSIAGRIVAAGTAAGFNPCLRCQPAVAGTEFSPAPNGTPCQDGVCIDGACDADSCVIDGVVYPNGTVNPANWCQACDVAKSRTSWQTLPDGSTCGRGCAAGVCQTGFGCAVFSSFGCPSNECGTGSCDVGTGACTIVPNPAAVGQPCTRITASPRLESQGTCSPTGQCLTPPAPAGVPCTPFSGTQCRSATAGTCNGSGVCLGNPLPNGTPCSGPRLCATYSCQAGNCTLSEFDQTHAEGVCEPDGCGFGTCDPVANQCQYGPYANGVTECVDDDDCCDGQVCALPVTCGQFCVHKFCYYPGTNVK